MACGACIQGYPSHLFCHDFLLLGKRGVISLPKIIYNFYCIEHHHPGAKVLGDLYFTPGVELSFKTFSQMARFSFIRRYFLPQVILITPG
jgi:hypothetical protein